MGQYMRLWYLSHRQPAKAQMSMCNYAISPEASLHAHTHKVVFLYIYTVKPVLIGHSKIDKTKIFKMTNGSLMKVESIAECCIAECSLGAFHNTFDLHLAIISLEDKSLVFKTNLWSSFVWLLKTGFTV